MIAVPDGTGDTYEFLEEQGWLEQADTYGELLFVLEPANGSWKAPEEESAYLKACLGKASETLLLIRVQQVREASYRTEGFRSVTAPPARFTGHSCNYYVGYGEGRAVLESWTSGNPLYVISQAFIGGGEHRRGSFTAFGCPHL